jgi:two-component system response regulator NreC
MTIRILIAEHHAVLRAALRALLDAEPDFEVVGEAEHMGGVFCLAAALRPEIILLDIGMPDLRGFQALRRLSRKLPTARVLLLTDSAESSLAWDALAAGVAGCVVSQAAETTLVTAIQTVAQGYIYVQPSLVQTLLTELRLQSLRPELGEEDLTAGEVDVVRLIAQGYTNRQVAEALDLSVQTVESHRASVMLKLGLHSRVELVRYASARRLVEMPK